MAKCEYCGKDVSFGIKFLTHTGDQTEPGNQTLKK